MQTVVQIFKRALLVGIVSYFSFWFVLYTLATGADYTYIIDYFRMSWTSGGEIPTVIQLLALFSSFILSVLVACFGLYRRWRNRVNK